MAYWSRVSQSQLKLLLHQWPRHCSRVSYASSLVHKANIHSGAFALGERLSRIDVRPGEFCYNARFFASGYSQARGSKEDENTGEPRLNGDITGQFVRLVSDSGHNVVSLREALEQAKRMNLDLVEVQRNADPPVCKIMDYHREKYVRVQKEKDRAKSKSDVMLKKGACKEVRFTKKTELKDLKMKADSVKRLMERGYRVKCVALPSAKKYEEQEDLGALLSNLTDLLEDTAVVESGPLLERKQAYVIVRHTKFGPSKKGVKKFKDAYAYASTDTSETSIEDPAETDTETEDEVFLNEDNRSRMDQAEVVTSMAGRASSLTPNVLKNHDSQRRHGPETADRDVPGAVPGPTTVENRYRRSEPDSKRPQGAGPFRFEPQSPRTQHRPDFRREPSSPPATGIEAPRFGVFSPPKEANNSSNNNVGNRYSATRR